MKLPRFVNFDEQLQLSQSNRETWFHPEPFKRFLNVIPPSPHTLRCKKKGLTFRKPVISCRQFSPSEQPLHLSCLGMRKVRKKRRNMGKNPAVPRSEMRKTDERDAGLIK